jgi:hypothetical protein
VGCRVVIHVACCCYPILEAYSILTGRFNELEMYIFTKIRSVLAMPSLFMAFMVYALEVLHIFWTFYIIKAFIVVNVSEKIAAQNYD